LSINYIVVLVTAANKAEAEKISKTLLEEKLIACANIVHPVTSFFYWKDKIDTAEECLMVLKSRLDLFSNLVQRLKGLHSYEVPEILALPIIGASNEYIEWMDKVLK
jgi:periplasmic divalent cation tolerance protein